jgi:ABC-type transport system involved in multi-copper enzyme maturation permease subunit
MTWLTWRQFRTQAWVTLCAIALIGVVLAVAESMVVDLYESSGAATCGAHCADAIQSFLSQVSDGMTGFVYSAAIIVVYVVPGVIGAFWGAPLVARELEAGTHRLAWNQSVTRSRWLFTKLALVGGASVVTMGLLSAGVMWYSRHIDQGITDQIQPNLFGARGFVPVAYGAFAFALGVTAGILIRRTVPAMAATLAVYLVLAIAFPLWIRAHLLPTARISLPLDTEHINGLMLNENTQQVTVIGDPSLPGWILSNQTITPSGAEFSGPADPQFCSGRISPGTCLDWIGTLHLRQSVVYQPSSHFWPLQWIESGIFLALTAGLIVLCVRWTRRLV